MAEGSPTAGTLDYRAWTGSDVAMPHYRRVVAISILAAVAIATTVLIGWALDVEQMKRILPGVTAMNPMTACCVLSACLSLWLARTDRPVGARGGLAIFAALCILFVGCTKLLDLAVGTQICPDALLFSAQLDRQLPYPSRIAPNVAGCFIVVGIALLAIDRPRWPGLLHPQLLMIPVLVIALAAVIGYGYDTSGFYSIRQFIPMALPSAVALIFVATAMIFSRSDQGFVRLLPPESSGARSVKMMLPACILIPSLLGWLTLIGADGGWFSGRGSSTALVAVLTSLTMSAFTIFNSIALSRAEAVRIEAEARLREAVVEIDARNRDLKDEVSERRAAEQLSAHRASHDFLTGLPNRLLFVDRLEQAFISACQNGEAFALIYIDIDEFKPINDRYGHGAGDALLIAFAKRLASLVREGDTVARLGGDEFGVIVKAPVSEENAVNLATRISDSATQRYPLRPGGHNPEISVSIGISIGVALLPGHAVDLDDLVKLADGAMYRAKVTGKAIGRSSNIEIACSTKISPVALRQSVR